jgi:MinD-like ATPase involved in chromosome partitioning or flagellar assembly
VPSPLIAVWSPKGGVGRTLIAAGLAMQLARRLSQQVLLVDLDAGNPGIAPLLQTSARSGVLDYPASAGRPIPHPSGIHLLPGPARLVDEGLVTGELAQAVLDRAQSEGYAVVADLSASLRDSTVIALERADAVLLVTTPDLLALYACRRFVQEAGLIGLSLHRFRLVINQVGDRQEIPEREVLDLTGLPLAGRIPSLPGLAAAVNRGMSTPTFRSNTDFAIALQAVADSLEFAGVKAAPIATVTAPLQGSPVGLIPALRRWWNSL